MASNGKRGKYLLSNSLLTGVCLPPPQIVSIVLLGVYEGFKTHYFSGIFTEEMKISEGSLPMAGAPRAQQGPCELPIRGLYQLPVGGRSTLLPGVSEFR